MILAGNELPRLGGPLSVLLSNVLVSQPGLIFRLGLSRTSWGIFPLPFPLDLAGLTGCQLYVSDEVLPEPVAPTPFGSIVW